MDSSRRLAAEVFCASSACLSLAFAGACIYAAVSSSGQQSVASMAMYAASFAVLGMSIVGAFCRRGYRFWMEGQWDITAIEATILSGATPLFFVTAILFLSQDEGRRETQ